MSSLAELEALALAAWNRDERAGIRPDPAYSRAELRSVMSAYAEGLKTAGDPRGGIIAFDLSTANQEERETERKALVSAWLGPGIAGHRSLRTYFGLLSISISQDDNDVWQALQESPAGQYLEAIRISGDADTVARTLGEIAKKVRPWLGRLGIHLRGKSYLFRNTSEHIIHPDQIKRVIDTAPGLHTLEVSGPGLLRDFSHQGLWRLVVDGYNTMGALSGSGEPLRDVIELDFAFHVHGDEFDPVEPTVRQLLPPSHLPALRRLDLTRNEPGHSDTHHLGGIVNSFRFMQNNNLHKQLTHLSMPSLRTEHEVAVLQSVLDDMPALVELSVRCCYVDPPPILRHSSANLTIPAPRPWLPLDSEMLRRYRFSISVSGTYCALDVYEAVHAMDSQYASFDATLQSAWQQFWYLFRKLENSASVTAPLPTVATALKSGAEVMRSDGWRRIAMLISTLPNTDDQVTLQRTPR